MAPSRELWKGPILEELENMLAANNLLIRQFLNHDEDFQLFLEHEARFPDRKALSQVNLVNDLGKEDYVRLLEEFHQARTETQEATGCEFECWRFLAGHQDLSLLQSLREETDRKLEARLSNVLPPEKEQIFLAQWNAVRKRQGAQSKITLGILLEDQS
ncbi:MAG: hypothetical protein QNL68_05365 [Akkermansiaceae bacterium]